LREEFIETLENIDISKEYKEYLKENALYIHIYSLFHHKQHSIRDIDKNVLYKIIKEFSNVNIYRKCYICEGKLDISDYLIVNYKNILTNKTKELISIWKSDKCLIPCCFCYHIIEEITQSNIKTVKQLFQHTMYPVLIHKKRYLIKNNLLKFNIFNYEKVIVL
jgi:hypothetical protein